MKVYIEVKGGMVVHVAATAPGVTAIIRDFDIETADADALHEDADSGACWTEEEIDAAVVDD